MNQLKKPHRTKTRSGTAVRGRGQERVADIIQMALTIFVEEGLVSLTTRRVARELDISIGNLLYYFGTKEDLLQAIIEHVVRGYDEGLTQESKLFPHSPPKRFKAFIRYIISDTKKPEVQGFFYQFWGMSTHNELAAKLREDMYRHFNEQATEILAGVHPKMSAAELGALSLSTITVLEGLHVVYGSSDQFLEQYPGFDDLIYSQILRNVGIGEDD